MTLGKKILLLVLAAGATLHVEAQGTAFTYQGQLNLNGAPANGFYDLTFTAFPTNTTGVALAGPVAVSAVAVSNGLFTTVVDLGGGVFTGPDRWLEIGVRTNTNNPLAPYTTLTPRQKLSPTPYAIFAGTAGGANGLNAPVSASQIITAGTITSNMFAPGAISALSAPDGSPPGAVQVDNNGSVGIGTSTPTAGLQITTGPTNTTLAVLFETQDGQNGWTNLDEANSAAVNGNLLAVGSVEGVTIANISNPAAPALLSQIVRGTGSYSNFSYITEVAWAGSTLIASAWGAMSGDIRAINFINCSSPTNPVKITEVRNNTYGFTNLGAITGVAVSGNVMILGSEADTITNTDCVVLADISNPTNPAPIKVLLASGVYSNLHGVSSVAVSGNLLAVGAIYGVTLIDISNPASPVKKADLIATGIYSNLYDVFSLSLSGNLLAIEGHTTNNGSGVTLVDVSNPASPIKLAEVAAVGSATNLQGVSSVALSANRLAVGQGSPGGVTLVDVTVPSNPTVIAAAKNGMNGADYLLGANVIFANGNIVACGNGQNFDVYGGLSILGVAKPQVGLESTGWVGIGTTNPLAPLDVMGNVLVENATIFNVNAQHVVMGIDARATGYGAVALGYDTSASGNYSIAAGFESSAGGDYSTALGYYNNASGPGATALGEGAIASGAASMAMGLFTTASGTIATAMGNQSVAAHDQTFVWSDGSIVPFSSTTSNEFSVLAQNGVRLQADLRVTGLIRSGLETNTLQAPNPAGLVVRRINSTTPTSNSVVAMVHTSSLAASNNVTLVRDGSAGGFQIHYPAAPGNLTIACMGIDTNGVSRNFYTGIANPGTAGIVQIYSNTQGIGHFECTFGDTYLSGDHLTRVTLSRFVGGTSTDNFWSGELVSTFNQ